MRGGGWDRGKGEGVKRRGREGAAGRGGVIEQVGRGGRKGGEGGRRRGWHALPLGFSFFVLSRPLSPFSLVCASVSLRLLSIFSSLPLRPAFPSFPFFNLIGFSRFPPLSRSFICLRLSFLSFPSFFVFPPHSVFFRI